MADYDFSLCRSPRSGLRFWLFHCHDYLADGLACGKPLFVECNNEYRNQMLLRTIAGVDYVDITKRVVGTTLYPLPDEAICDVFNAFTGETWNQHNAPLFRHLLMVPRPYVLTSISVQAALYRAMEQPAPWGTALLRLASYMRVPLDHVGLTGSWAIGAQHKHSDVDLVFSVSPSKVPNLRQRLYDLQNATGGRFPDKYGLFWPLRVRSDGYEWCLFITYESSSESPLTALRLAEASPPAVVRGVVSDDRHGCYCPTVLRIRRDTGQVCIAVFPSTEARGVFTVGDTFEATGVPYANIDEGVDAKAACRELFVITNGLSNCPSLKRKIAADR